MGFLAMRRLSPHWSFVMGNLFVSKDIHVWSYRRNPIWGIWG
jgi:hypothetical protein